MKTSFRLSGLLDIADCCCRLTVLDPGLGAYIKREYVMQDDGPIPLFEVTVSREGGILLLQGGRLTHRIPYKSNPDYSEYNFADFVISSYIAAKLLSKNVLFIHASSFDKNGQGLAYAGMSGAGKSTILKNAQTALILSEDTAVLRKTARGFNLYASPFDKKHLPSPPPAPVPLSKIYFLKQSTKNRENNISMLLAFVFLKSYEIYSYGMKYFSGKGDRQEKMLSSLLLRLLYTVKTRRLLFTKDYRPQ